MRPNAPYVLVVAAFLCCIAGLARAQQYELAGVTAYDPVHLLGYAAGAVAARDGTVSGEGLADTIELIYREDGYFLAEVYLDPDGRTVLVEEGEIGDIVIEGADVRTAWLIRSYLEPLLGMRPVRRNAFERAIMLVEDIESIAASAEIDYPRGSDKARVRVVVEAGRAGSGFLTLDHPAREPGEAATLQFGQEFYGLLLPGDLLRLRLSGTTRFEDHDNSVWGSVTYRAPIGGAGAYGEAYFGSVAARRERSGALQETDLRGMTAILALGYPVLRDVETYGYAIVEARHASTDVDVAGTRFESGVVAAGLAWIHGRTTASGGAWEYALDLTIGQRVHDSSTIDDGDDHFFHLRGGLGIDHATEWFGPHSSFRAEFWGQITGNDLPGVEKFHLGGNDDERGYLFAEAQGDSGLSATLEVGRDFFPEYAYLRRVRPYGFIDAGLVANNDPSPDEFDHWLLASLGLGLEADLAGGVFVRGHVALPLVDGPATAALDPAFYLSLTKSW